MIWLLYIGGGIIAFLAIGTAIEHYFIKTHVYIMPVFDSDGIVTNLSKEGLATLVQIKGNKVHIVSHKEYVYVNYTKLAMNDMRRALRQDLVSHGIPLKNIVFVYKVRTSFFYSRPRIRACKEIIPCERFVQKGPPTEGSTKLPELQKVARAPMHRLR